MLKYLKFTYYQETWFVMSYCLINIVQPWAIKVIVKKIFF